MNHILYAVYGSNLLYERFICYINGNSFCGKTHKGCKDKSPPIDFGYMFTPHRLYFAKKSPSWGYKGVAFLNPSEELDKNFHTLIRLWRITEEQFHDIHSQEGIGWYHLVENLGEKDGYKVKTLTGEHFRELNCPSEKYQDVIRRGLIETTSWSNEACNEYLAKFI